jgi:uncharacterized protein (TIGR02996 family)
VATALADVLRTLNALFTHQQWAGLRDQAQAAAAAHPDNADVCGYVAHAMRQLGELEGGYTWAVRGATIDPQNLFVTNRVTLLANLTGRFEDAFVTAVANLERVVTTAQDAQNLAVMIVNGIYAAHRLGKIAEAAPLFTPVIERLDHPELHFNSACLYALAGDDRVFRYTAKALATGKPKSAFADSDFAAVDGDPRFVELLTRDWDAEASALKRSHKQTRDELRPEDFIDPSVMTFGTAPDTDRNVELERAIDANPDELAGYLVYSDWLQERGNSRGLLVLASRRCAEARTESERMLAYVDWAVQVMKHGEWLGPIGEHLARHSRAVWRHGFVSELVFDVGYKKKHAHVGELLASTLQLPMLRFVRALSIGDIWTNDELSYTPVVDALLGLELPALRSLAIAPNTYEMSWSHLDATGLAAAFPALETLVLGAGNLETGPLDHATLKRFAIRTGGLTQRNLDAVLAARWPELVDLELWFGSSDYGADVFETSDLAPILNGRGLGKLRRLALKNAELTDAICAALVHAPVVAQLTELDLSMGTMSDEGAAALVTNAKRFAHLAKLSVADNALSPNVVTELREVFPNIETGTQKTDRYVTVGE